MARKRSLLFDGREWTVELIDKTWNVLDDLAKNKYGLDYYPPQIEIVSEQQMLDAITSIGLPTYYNHWSFGKHKMSQDQAYKRQGTSGCLELIINSDPA